MNVVYTANELKHMRVYMGDRPCKCHLCDEAFTESGSLKNHLRVHIGEKTYKCHLCNDSFSDFRNLQRHKRHLHSNTTDELKQDENV